MHNSVGIRLKIAVISDLHLGAKWGTEREEDSFDQAREAFERAVALGAKLILVPGDIFEFRIPRQEILAKAMKILSVPQSADTSGLKLSDTIDKSRGDISSALFRGIPVVALHGNHERRSAGLVNPVQALEAAGLLIHLHHNSVVFSTRPRRVAIHGMSNVPERHAFNVFETWKPKPVEGAFNVLMLHQSLGKYVYSSKENPTIELPDLPPGFDLYVCGHIHYCGETEIHGKPLIFPGSTIRTQLIPIEADRPKGFYMVNLGSNVTLEFVELESVRDFHYEEKTFEGASINDIERYVRTRVREILDGARRNSEKIPLIKFRLRGSLARDASRSDFDIEMLQREFRDQAIVTIGKSELASPGLEEKVKLLRELREQRISIEEMGMELLDSNLKDMGFDHQIDVHAIYGLLVEDRFDEALELVISAAKKMAEKGESE